MYMVMKALYGEFLGDMEFLGTFEKLKDAQDRMLEDMLAEARSEGLFDEDDEDAEDIDDMIHNDVDADGLDYGYCDVSNAEWRIFSTEPHPAQTKVCPSCGTEVFADMDVCYGCLHKFDEE